MEYIEKKLELQAKDGNKPAVELSSSMGQDLVIQKSKYQNNGRRGGMLLPCVHSIKDGKLTRRR